jgi:hypothetical protein
LELEEEMEFKFDQKLRELRILKENQTTQAHDHELELEQIKN